ncbi:MAG TPA: hypothetical protein VMG10_29415 [Gemmataceae bacterium]|nr:hypothetical protein [Gemmataceae bacterium]
MNEFMLPDDFVSFLDAGKQLEYDPDGCEAGAVTLHRRPDLRLRTFGAHCGGTPYEAEDPGPSLGVYRVQGVDLIASCDGDYYPEGLLVWLPGELSFGAWDPAHDYIFVFGQAVTWSQIAASPARYINAQWGYPGLDRAQADFLRPWGRYPHESEKRKASDQ